VAKVRGALLGAVALVGWSGSVACGPSFQAVYEGEVRFEHCYALDQGPVGPDAKKDCWRDWLHVYTYGQSRDRIEYAATRFSELSLDPTLPSEDTGARPKRARKIAAPIPTSAFAPPPNVAGDGPQPPAPTTAPGVPTALNSVASPSASPDARPAPTAGRAPGEECATACAERWNACRRGCADGACDACDGGYRACVPGCFRDVGQPPRSLR
jgi:hypothetical protein